MNVTNALGFFILGTLMHVAQELAVSTAATAQSLVVAISSVQADWLVLMSWVIGGIGGSYLLREGVVRVNAFVASVVPERLLQPAEAKPETLPEGVRVGVSN